MNHQPTTHDTEPANAPHPHSDSANLQSRHTTLGTPCPKVWSDDWIASVDQTETRLRRPICGARTMAGVPCTLQSNHPTGRCRFHGGFDLTGAPKGNRNAVIHGLYSRRLQVCGTHCPLWTSCPLAGQDVLDLARGIPPPRDGEAPAGPHTSLPTSNLVLGTSHLLLTCPYEQAEYNAAVTDGLAHCEQRPNPNPMDKHLVHNLALLQVMMSRAAAALRSQQLVETVSATGDHYQMQSTKLHAYLQAFLRLANEYRRFRNLLQAPDRTHPATADPYPDLPSIESVVRQDVRAECDTDLEPQSQARIHFPDFPAAEHAARLVQHAIQCAAAGNDVAMIDAMERAYTLAPKVMQHHENRILAAYRPNGVTLPESAVKKMLKRLKQKPP